jgi:hypothetical protein
MNQACPIALAWTQQYEALRQHAVQPLLGGSPLGAVLVANSGLAGWMRQWPQASATAAHRSESVLINEPASHHELTLILAQITARHLSTVVSL